jgi:aminoglycoside phosphotransferase (APT) family kinase protein
MDIVDRARILRRMTAFPPGLLPLLRRDLPDARFNEIHLLGEGWNAVAWRLPAPDGHWVVRVPKLEYARDEIERQTCLAPKLDAAGIPCPRDWRLLRDADGSTAAGLYRYVDGSPAPRSGPRRLRALAPRIADLLNRLHRLPHELALACGGGLSPAWPGLYSGLIAGLSPSLGPKSAAWVRNMGAELAAASQTAPAPVFVHADLAPWHLLLDSEGDLVAVLDFPGPVLTDPAIDFGRLVQHWGIDFAEAVLASYSGDIDANFSKRMMLYARLEPLKTIQAGLTRGQQGWVDWGRRRVAAAAAARRTPP